MKDGRKSLAQKLQSKSQDYMMDEFSNKIDLVKSKIDALKSIHTIISNRLTYREIPRMKDISSYKFGKLMKLFADTSISEFLFHQTQCKTILNAQNN